MLCGNCCDLEEQTSNTEWGSGVFSTVYWVRKRVVLFDVLKVLWKDNVSNVLPIAGVPMSTNEFNAEGDPAILD